MEGMIDNVIEWLNGDETVTVTFSQRKYISKIKKLAEKFPDEVKIVAENSDGSIVAHLPLSAIKISIIKRELTDEQRQEMADRMRNLHNTDEDDS